MRRCCDRVLKVFFIHLWSAFFLVAQVEPVENSEQTIRAEKTPSTSLQVLKGLDEQLRTLRDRAAQQDGDEKAEAQGLIKRLESEFNELLAGKEAVEYFEIEGEKETLQQEIIDIFKPLVSELKNATAGSREKELLRSQVEVLMQQTALLERALRRIEKNTKLAQESDPQLYQSLLEKETLWQGRLDQTILRLNSAKLQLQEKETSAKNSVESASQFFGKFFRSRGLHLLMASLVAAFVFFSINIGYKLIARYSPAHKKHGAETTVKTIDGVVHLGSFVLSVLSVIITFFLCDDWVLLSASILLFAGLAWSLKDKIPEFAEEIRLILNIGAVREGERIIIDGLPWQVQKIRVYSQLLNPSLEGGYLRVPLNRLVGLYSRPCSKFEKYFPTEVNDWVKLADGTFGKIVLQSPEYVEMVQLGGSRKTYSTSDFLAQSPENLSGHHFRIKTRFGIDYALQSKVTTEYKDQLETFMKNEILAHLDEPKDFFRLKVEFASASASSLDFDIFADFSGSSAPKYFVLERLLQKLAVEACNQYGWGIPFTQITVHQATES